MHELEPFLSSLRLSAIVKVKLREKATTQIHTVEVQWESDAEWHGVAEEAENRQPQSYVRALYELVEEESE